MTAKRDASGGTAWQMMGTDGVYVDIDATGCQLDHMLVQYSVSVVGSERRVAHDQWGGLHGSGPMPHTLHQLPRPAGPMPAPPLKVTSQGVRVIVRHPRLRAEALLRAVHAEGWMVSWVGDAGRNAGRTVAGASGWQQVLVESQGGDGNMGDEESNPLGGNTLGVFLEVDTRLSKFQGTPRYFPELYRSPAVAAAGSAAASGALSAAEAGTRGIRVWGMHTVYHPRATSFRLYVIGDAPLEAAEVEKMGWTVSWLGMDPADKRGGSSHSSQWKVATWKDVNPSAKVRFRASQPARPSRRRSPVARRPPPVTCT
jgi:hypothetical protein